MGDDLRYSRQEKFSEIGKIGQKKIEKASAVIVGCGALGSRCAELLTRAGIGKLILIDMDITDITNLQRQTFYNESDIGKKKAESLREHITKINSGIVVKAIADKVTRENASVFPEADIVFGCTDNLESRFIINDFSVKNKIPWVHGGAVMSIGNVMVIFPDGPCFRCIFQEASGLPTANTHGIVNSNPAIIAALQVSEGLKIILGKEHEKDLIYFDCWKNEFTKIKIKKNPDCPICSKGKN